MATEQKLDPTVELQLILCDCHDVENSHEITITRSKLLVPSLIAIAKKEMDLSKVKKIYRENGIELSSANLYKICNNDTLYVSDGSILKEKLGSIHLCVMGPGAVGKSAVTLRFIQGQFIGNYDPTIEDAYRKTMDVDGNKIALDILDTAGQEDFKCLQTQWMKDKDGFILVFSVVQRASFHQLEDMVEKISEVYEDIEVPPIIIVGNKVDLDSDHSAFMPKDEDEDNFRKFSDSIPSVPPERQVTLDESVTFATRIDAVSFIETSAKSGYNVENMFGQIARHLINIKYSDERTPLEPTEHNRDSGDAKWWTKCQIL